MFSKQVWIEVSSRGLPDHLISCSVESAVIHMKNATHSICVIFDRFIETTSADSSRKWLEKLRRAYGDLIIGHTPEYANVFSGTLFEETYVNSADLSFMGPAMIWALLWKNGGLVLSPDTILVSGLHSYYNFVVLNSTSNGGSLSITQFTERHHDLPGLYRQQPLTFLDSIGIKLSHLFKHYISSANLG